MIPAKIASLILWLFPAVLCAAATRVDVVPGESGNNWQVDIHNAPAQTRLQVLDGISPLGVAIADAAGHASLSIQLLRAGQHSLRAVEWGSGRIAGEVTLVTAAPPLFTGFRAPTLFSSAISPIAMAAADIFGSGHPDILLAGDGRITILRNVSGDGSFAGPVLIPGLPDPVNIAVADFDGDGRNDFVVAGKAGRIAIFLNRGDGVFTALPETVVGSNIAGLAVADFNGDGIPDLAVSLPVRNSLTVLFGKGDGTFREGKLAADLKGAADILAALNRVDRTATAFVGEWLATTRAGGFIQVGPYTLQGGPAPGALASADFNGDGIPDLVEADAAGAVSLFFGIAGATGAAAPAANPSFQPLAGGFTLGTNLLFVGNAAATNSVQLAGSGAWTASANASWLHLSSSSTSGTGNSIVIFTFDANSGPTRSGTITFNSGALTLTVTQAGSVYVPANWVVPLFTTGPGYNLSNVAVDGSGNVYYANFLVGVMKWSASSQQITTLTTAGPTYPYGVLSDAAGNLYIESRDNSYTYYLQKWTAATQQLSTLVSSGLTAPGSMALDSSGNLYVADNLLTVKKWTVATQQLTTLPTPGVNTPVAVAVDSLGNVYIADRSDSEIFEWSPVTQQVTLLASGLDFGSESTVGLAVDSSGNVYFDGSFLLVYCWNAATGQINPVSTSTPLFFPAGLAVSGGNIYLYDSQGAVQLLVNAFVDPSPKTESAAAGSDSLSPVIPASISMVGLLAPTADQSWLTAGNTTNGIVSFSFTANPASSVRGAHITVLGQRITVTQAGVSLSLGTTQSSLGPSAGTSSVALAATVPWTAMANVSWLHLSPGSDSGVSGQNILFTYDLNNAGTRTGAITFNGYLTLTVTQAGNGFAPVYPVSTLLLSSLNFNIYSIGGVAVDASGNVYFSDPTLLHINQWNSTTRQPSTFPIYSLSQPRGVALDTRGNIYFADTGASTIREWNVATQQVTTVTSAVNAPQGVAVDAAGNVYIADTGHRVIKVWNAASGQVTTLGPMLMSPVSVALDSLGNIYVVDAGDNSAKQWNASAQQFSTIVSGLSSPSGIAVDGNGNVYIADTGNNVVRIWNVATQQVSILPTAGISAPTGVAVDRSGNIYVAGTVYINSYNSTIGLVMIAPAFAPSAGIAEPGTAGSDSLPAVVPASTSLSGVFTPTSDEAWLTIGGVVGGVVNFSFTANAALSARMAHITVLGQSIPITQAPGALSAGTLAMVVGPSSGGTSVAMAATVPWTVTATVPWLHISPGSSSGTGNQRVAFTYDANSGTTRAGAISFNNGAMTVAVTQAGSTYAPVNSLETLVLGGFISVDGLATDSANNIYISDGGLYVPNQNSYVDKYSWSTSLSTYVATAPLPGGVAVDTLGNVYFSDAANNLVNVLSPVTGQVTALVSNGLNAPFALAVDASGSVYIADTGNNALKMWSAATRQVTTLVTGLLNPRGVAVDASGNVYIADTGHSALKLWNPVSQQVTTLPANGLSAPHGVATDAAGNVYIADPVNSTVFKWNVASQTLSAIIGGNSLDAVAVDGFGNVDTASSSDPQLSSLLNFFVNTTGINEPAAGGSDSVPILLPAFPPLIVASRWLGSDQSWLTVSSVTNGQVNFSFTPNTSGIARVAHISVFLTSIAVTQASSSTKLAFAAVPAGGQVGSPLSHPVVVQVEDVSGNVITTSTAAVTLTSVPSNVSVTVNAVNGVATFNNLVFTVAGSYTLTASSTGVTSAVSTPIVIARSPSKIAIFRAGMWLLDSNGNSLWDGSPPDSIDFIGQSGDIAVSGDWNGDGRSKIGIFRNGLWVLDYNGNGQWDGPLTDRVIFLGQAGDIPVVGDWNGDGRAKVGIFRNGLWVLDYNGNGQWDGIPMDRVISLGQAGDIPIVGDWNGTGFAKAGIFRDGLWVLDYNGNGAWDGTPTDRVISLGQTGDVPVVGDWNGTGFAKAGIFRNGLWVLDYNGNGAWDGTPTDRVIGLGQAGDIALVGDWNGDGRAKVGIFRNGLWVLDYNGNGAWDGAPPDAVGSLGQTGDTPLIGRW